MNFENSRAEEVVHTFVSQREAAHLGEILEGLHANHAGRLQPHDGDLVLLHEPGSNLGLFVRFLVHEANEGLDGHLLRDRVNVAHGGIARTNDTLMLQDHHLERVTILSTP